MRIFSIHPRRRLVHRVVARTLAAHPRAHPRRDRARTVERVFLSRPTRARAGDADDDDVRVCATRVSIYICICIDVAVTVGADGGGWTTTTTTRGRDGTRARRVGARVGWAGVLFGRSAFAFALCDSCILLSLFVVSMDGWMVNED